MKYVPRILGALAGFLVGLIVNRFFMLGIYIHLGPVEVGILLLVIQELFTIVGYLCTWGIASEVFEPNHYSKAALPVAGDQLRKPFPLAARLHCLSNFYPCSNRFRKSITAALAREM